MRYDVTVLLESLPSVASVRRRIEAYESLLQHMEAADGRASSVEGHCFEEPFFGVAKKGLLV